MRVRTCFGVAQVGSRTVRALILAVLVDVLELLERLDDVHVLPAAGGSDSAHRSTSARLRMRAPEVHDDVLAARVEHVVEERERLEDVAPVLSLVVQPLVEHLDDLHKVVSAMVAQTKVGRGKSGTSGQLLASQRCHNIAVIS